MLDIEMVMRRVADQVEKDFPNDELPIGLSAPLEYTLKLPAKRYRCFLLFMAYRLYAPDIEGAVDAAMAIEYFHNFTLIHDDIMDQARFRRGKPPVYKKWNTNTAILSGDLLLILAYKKLHKIQSSHLVEVLTTFNQMAQEVCVGQQYDMDFEKEEMVSLKRYEEMIRLKTSVLLGTALKIGGMLGGGTSYEVALLYKLGIVLGQMFQMQDDYIDVFGMEEKTGKKQGGDILANKKSFVSIFAWEAASKPLRDRMSAAYNITSPTQKVAVMMDIYREIEVDMLLREELSKRYREVTEVLNRLKIPDVSRRFFEKFIEQIYKRQH